MARQEADREDLLAEAVALTRRVEGIIVATGQVIVAGFRQPGWLSIYFGSDPMYQVDDAGRLRRAFERGLLYRTQGITLARLTRTRSETETTLLRDDLSPAEIAAFRGRMTDRLTEVVDAMESYGFQPLRQVPNDDAALISDVAARLRLALSAAPWLAPPIAARG
ncbi:MAG TPA: hypothetical protein VM165_05820 [Planctomycetaceae bacterium]|nr:hypothetical protein [Planctomycetaceae bacterium]